MVICVNLAFCVFTEKNLLIKLQLLIIKKLSNKHSIYIQYVTPKTKTKTVVTSFQFQLQDCPTLLQNILGFGERSHKVLHEFVCKSLVKMNLFKNDKYHSLIYNEKKYLHSRK